MIYLHGGHKVTQKRSPSFFFFVYYTGYVKFWTKIEQKIVCFMFFKFYIFWRENDITDLAPKFFLHILELLMTDSLTARHKDPETEKISEIC